MVWSASWFVEKSISGTIRVPESSEMTYRFASSWRNASPFDRELAEASMDAEVAYPMVDFVVGLVCILLALIQIPFNLFVYSYLRPI